jgi:hypothetical protein
MVNLWPFTYNIGGLKAFNGAFIWEISAILTGD